MEALTLDRPVELPELKGPITFQEFIARVDGGVHAELEDGEVIFMSPASVPHQELSGWLYTILRFFVRHRRLGRILQAPFTVRRNVSGQGREPDLLFIGPAKIAQLHSGFLDGPPDLVVEIISPESIDRDRGRKFVEYEAEKIHEYWLIDPIREQAEFYRLGSDSRYHQALPDADGIFYSESVPGFWLRTPWMWEDPLPSELDVLRELDVIS